MVTHEDIVEAFGDDGVMRLPPEVAGRRACRAPRSASGSCPYPRSASPEEPLRTPRRPV